MNMFIDISPTHTQSRSNEPCFFFSLGLGFYVFKSFKMKIISQFLYNIDIYSGDITCRFYWLSRLEWWYIFAIPFHGEKQLFCLLTKDVSFALIKQSQSYFICKLPNHSVALKISFCCCCLWLWTTKVKVII